MDKIKQYYSQKTQIVKVPKNHNNENVEVAGAHLFNPNALHHLQPFHLRQDLKKATFDLEETATPVFQHVPTFAYLPHTSNIDVHVEE